MWIRREFVWDAGNEMEPGWRLSTQPGFDTVSGLGVAHDVMEHFTLDGSLVDEAHAFGTMLWGRVEGSWVGWPDGTRYPYIMAPDAAQFISLSGSTLPARGPAKPLYDDELEGLVQKLQLEILRVLPEQAEMYNSDYDWVEDGSRHAALFCAYVREGYRKAARRWGGMHNYTWADLFSQIDKHPLSNEEPDSENDKLIVSVNIRRSRVNVRIAPYVDPFDY